MRVLHVITGLAAGGAERQLALLLRHTPYDADVVTLTNPGTVAAELRADGVRVAHLGMGGNRDVGALPRLVRLVRDGRYDLVHTHLYRACLYGRVAARLAGVRHVVATEHSIGAHLVEGRRITPSVRGLYLAAERLGQATIAVSDTVAARLAAWGVPAGRIAVIPNGIDAEVFRYDAAARARVRARHGIPADAVVIGGLGRLVADKRHDVTLRAAARLAAEREAAGVPGRVAVLLAGAGPARDALAKLAAGLGIADRVRFAGETDDVPGMLAAADVLASPSPEEAFGLGVIEALACGLPVVYTACPALDDAPPEVTGGAAPAWRAPSDAEAFRRALAAALADPPKRTRQPPVVARYAITRLAAQVAGLYEDVVHGRPRPRATGAPSGSGPGTADAMSVGALSADGPSAPFPSAHRGSRSAAGAPKHAAQRPDGAAGGPSRPGRPLPEAPRGRPS